ncbi:MAG: DUF892 family protein [Anditalea sp.]
MIFEDHPFPEGIEKLNTSKIHELFLTKLMELYQGEMRLLEVLSTLQEASCTDHLKKNVSEYQRKKGEQVERLQQVFLLDLPISGKNNRVMEVMMEECNNLTMIGKNLINDFAIGNMIMLISHLNQAAYQWLSSLALKLEMQQIIVFFEESFNMEKEIDMANY